jgi:hypothetical protein
MVKIEDSLRKEKGGARRAVKEKMGFVMAGFLGNFGELWILMISEKCHDSHDACDGDHCGHSAHSVICCF